MACVVTVKENVIKKGELKHSDLKNIWNSEIYDGLRDWLLSLTETFDLTVRVKNQNLNIVPCLLSG
jgi:hypothetical protein